MDLVLNHNLKSMNKSQMKMCFLEHGIRTVGYRLIQSLHVLKAVAAEISYPIMVKAVDSSRSRGITKVEFEVRLQAVF